MLILRICICCSCKIKIYTSLLYLFKKIKTGLCDHAVRVSVYPPYQLLNAWINLYKTWHVYHVIRAHLNGVPHKSLLSVCVYVYAP
jgi:hypothetical protein